MHLLVVSYEFTFSPFSGNGILARSLVKSLLLLEDVTKVTVFCCRPHKDANTNTNTNNNTDDRPLESPELPASAASKLEVFAVELPATQRWKCLDIESAWREFHPDANRLARCDTFLQQARSCDAVLVVDWTGAHAWRLLQETLRNDADVSEEEEEAAVTIPMIYCNYRVYSLGATEEKHHDFYNTMERRALEEASVIIALSDKDREALQRLLSAAGQEVETTPGPIIHVLVPPLRGDVQALANIDSASNQSSSLRDDLPTELKEAVQQASKNQDDPRIFVTCIARLGREKQVARFVQFVKETPELWKNTASSSLAVPSPQLIPVLIGAVSDPEYANTVTTTLRKSCPAAIILNDRFLSARELAAILLYHTRLNVHPCAYEAYGMTIIEAAAFGVPSIVLSRTGVGALATLGDDATIVVEESSTVSESDGVDDVWDNTAMIATIRDALANPATLAEKGLRSKAAALAWNEQAYGMAVLSLVHNVLQRDGRQSNNPHDWNAMSPRTS